MANLETPPTPRYNSDMFNDLSEMSRIMKDNDEALNDDIANAGGDTSALEPGGRLGVHIGGTTGDLNDLTETGWYQSSGTGDDNRPPASGSLEIQVVALASGSVFQTVRTHGDVNFPYGEKWVRNLRGAQGWSDWRLQSLAPTSFTPNWINGKFVGPLDFATYSVADGVATVEVSQRFGAGTYGDIQLSNPLAAHTRPPGSTKVIHCAGRLTSSGTTAIATPAGLLSSDGSVIYARLLVVSGEQIVQRGFTSSNPGGVTSNGRITATWTFAL